MAKITRFDSRISGESQGEIEVRTALSDFETTFIDWANDLLIGQLRNIGKIAEVPRVSSKIEDNFGWEGWIEKFSQKRSYYNTQLAWLKRQNSGISNQALVDKLGKYAMILKDFDPSSIQGRDMEGVIKSLEDYMKRFETVRGIVA